MTYDYNLIDTGCSMWIQFHTTENGWSGFWSMPLGYQNNQLPSGVKGNTITQIRFERHIFGYWEFHLDYMRIY